MGFAGAAASFSLGLGVSSLVSAMPRFFENLKATKEEPTKLLAVKSEAEKLDSEIKQSTSYTGVLQKLRDDLPLMRCFLDEFVRGNLIQDNAAIETEIAQLEARKIDLEGRLESCKTDLKECPDNQIRAESWNERAAGHLRVVADSEALREVSEEAQLAREIFLQELVGTMKALTADAQAAHAARLEVSALTAGFLES